MSLAGEARLYLLRAPHASARINSIDTSVAKGRASRLRRRAAGGDERRQRPLLPLGVRHFEMPATPARLWKIREAKG